MKLRDILLVEDDPAIQTVAKMALEVMGGFNVRTCGSGEEAIAAASEGPQLILLDVMMPGMDGPTVLQRLRALPQTRAIPVVFMTAKTTAQEVAQLRALGALDVIAKPFDAMTLAAALDEIWARPRS